MVLDGATSERAVTAAWVIDATGRVAMLPRKLGHWRPNPEHPINAIWARFTGVKDWDSYSWRERYPDYALACRTPRSWATNHLMGYGWWCWIIPLRGGDVSAGLVYDTRIFKPAEGGTLAERLQAHILGNPVGREIFQHARVIDGDVHAFSSLSYSSEQVCDQGWACVGDAAGFIDPLYSPGLDFCAYTSYYVAELISQNLAGENVTEGIDHYNQQYPIMYRCWFEALFKDKYYYMGDAELMSAGLLLDIASYYFGLVIRAYKNPEEAFGELPFQGPLGGVAAWMIKFYNRRLVALAKRRHATGCFGRHNAGWRDLYDGFIPDKRTLSLLRKGLFRWWKAELTNLRLILAPPDHGAAERGSTTAPVEA